MTVGGRTENAENTDLIPKWKESLGGGKGEYGPRRNRLQRQREESFVDNMLGSLSINLDDDNNKSGGEVEQPGAGALECSGFDVKELLMGDRTSWRQQRNLLSSPHIKSQRSINDDLRRQRRAEKQGATVKVKRDSSAVELNHFLHSVKSQIAEAVLEAESFSPQRLSLDWKRDSVNERPAQLIQLQECEAGSALDELNGARDRILSKLNSFQ